MGDKMFGRWIARLVVTVGASAVALGLSSAVAHASDQRQLAVHMQLVSESCAAVAPAAPPMYVTEDFAWD
ncbi:hypothetical protein [Dactylosporangium salmoneum]